MTSAGNPVLSAPNGRQLDRALSGLDFMVAIDFYVNETTRHAHVILPPTFALEHEHYDVVFHVLLSREIIPIGEETDSLKKERKLSSYWHILTEDGTLHDISKFNFKNHDNLKKSHFMKKKKQEHSKANRRMLH